MLEIRIEKDGVIHLSGKLDASQVKVAEARLDPLAESMTLDLSRLDYISSAGIGVLLKTYKRLEDKGLRLRLVNLSQPVRTVLRFAGLEEVFTRE